MSVIYELEQNCDERIDQRYEGVGEKIIFHSFMSVIYELEQNCDERIDRCYEGVGDKVGSRDMLSQLIIF